MRVPSYDDLTPSIPDVTPGEAVSAVARVLPFGSAPAAPHRMRPAMSEAPQAPSRMFACLRSPRGRDITAIARDFSPRIQHYGPACVVLDVSGLGRLLGDAEAIAGELQGAARERSKAIDVAVAPTQTAAMLLAYARTPLDRGPAVVTADLDAALASVPLTVLRQVVEEAYGLPPALHERTFDVLRRWGLTTAGEFVALPAAGLSARIGQSGLALQRLARGLDASPLVPDPGVPRFIQTMELEWPIEQLEPLSFVLARLLDPLSLALERADRGAAAIHLHLRLVDRTTHERLLQLPAAMRDARVLRTLVVLDLESHPPAAGIDIVSIEADPAPARIIQYSLLERARPSAETLATLTARLNALAGETRCGSAALLDTHQPDAFEMRRFDGRGQIFPPQGSRSDPDRPCLRRFRPPVAVRVTMARGRPAFVAIDRRGMPGGVVERAAGPWRTSGAWWHGARWDRDEWDVAFAGGTLCRLYRDRLADCWFVDGVLD
jgi:protein ImuB